MSRCSSVELELTALKHALTLVKTDPDETLDSKRRGTLFVQRMRCVTDAIGPRAQDTLQAEAAVVNGLTEEVGHERRLGGHREREMSAEADQRRST